MKRVKLYALWVGPVPPWMDNLRDRVCDMKHVDVQLLRFDSPADVARSMRAAIPDLPEFEKGTPYACGDLRPWLGEWLKPIEEWWGWMDLDIIPGDWDCLLPPLLDGFDVISAEPSGTAGCLTLFRNVKETCELWRRSPEWREVLLDHKYRNFDEVGFQLTGGNPSITKVLRTTGLRCHFDWRSWHQDWELLTCGGAPSRGCEVDGPRVLEVPTGRELLLYHFRAKTGWPVPNPWANLRPEQEACVGRGRQHKILDPGFWAERLARAKAGGEIHRAVYDVSLADWNNYQRNSRSILKEHVRRGQTVLDAGCGYGALREVMPTGINYAGCDFCVEMVNEANSRMPGTYVMDLRNLQFDSDSKDWVVCRNLEHSAEQECADDWAKMRREMLRVGRRLLLIDFKQGARVVERL